jgi:hypothetical protein
MSPRRFDVFNGDADGICALHQLRLAEPAESILVTGLKRDIALLDRVDAGEADVVTVLDVSLARNRAAVERLLDRGAEVRYFDHHACDGAPVHPRFTAVLDPSGEACTSELVDRHLGGRFRHWAVVGAFGDNLPQAALRLAAALWVDVERLMVLRRLGEAINYNAYGVRMEDVMVPPADLYRLVSRYRDPFELIEAEAVVERLARERSADLARACAVAPHAGTLRAEVHVLPDEPWSRRVLGTFANHQALADPHRAHAVLAPLPGDGLVASVRVPPRVVPDAAQFCRGFATGGGRARAAGIERLEHADLDDFVRRFEATYREPLHDRVA